MTWGFVAAAGSTLVGAYGANKAAKAQLQGAREGAAAEERMFNRQVELQEPFRQVGVNALPDLVEASRYDPFTLEKFQADPGYQFRLREGLKALDSTAAARGGYCFQALSCAALLGLGRSLGRKNLTMLLIDITLGFKIELNPLQSLAGVGQTSTNTLSNAAGQLGSSLSNLAVGAGNARASGYAGTANALASGIGQGYNYYQGQQAQNSNKEISTPI
jgi:hypothetical protein